jgi:hypothetical protein
MRFAPTLARHSIDIMFSHKLNNLNEKVMSPRFIRFSAMAFLSAGLGAGCATQGPVPTQQLTVARTLVEQADKANAQRYAPADLQRAHDELSSADKAVADHKYDDARRYAESAQVDADLASARANSGEAAHAAEEVGRSIDSLKEESDRHANNPNAN